MRRDPRAYLWDVKDAAEAIAEFLGNIDEARYARDPLVRAAVERKLEIIGEALNKLDAADANLAATIPQRRQAIGMRNVLIHGYASVDNRLVWRTANEDIPALLLRVRQLIDDDACY